MRYRTDTNDNTGNLLFMLFLLCYEYLVERVRSPSRRLRRVVVQRIVQLSKPACVLEDDRL